MLWLAFGLILLFAAIYIRERLAHRETLKHMHYIRAKLDELAALSAPSGERVKVVTGQSEVRELARAANEWVDLAGKSAADYEATKQAMRKMLSNVSHDLKTPLTVILGYAEILENSSDMTEEERLRLLGQIHKKALEVLDLMNAFFDLSKLEADDAEMPLAMLDAGELARRRILEYYDLLAAGGCEVDIDIPDLPFPIYANEEALSRILDNLLSNAIRYGTSGRYLGLTVRKQESSILFEVVDRGPGIPYSEQSFVFERLYTLEDSRNRKVQGSGLGLTIAKRLAEKLGGTLELHSVPHVRTCFTLSLREANTAYTAGKVRIK
ncbi:sensor histidine kinase [Paenibacillus sp. GCM10027627]|uniref:sensor histidine kinase n=1 Tax=unclassified Paenibacillus TaxID=185978 RepID=UPI003642E51B